MRDLLLQCSGVAAIVAALIHGVLGETKVFARATIEPPRLRTLIRLVWQAGTVAWIGGGVLLMAAPSFGSESARHWIVVTIVAVAVPTAEIVDSSAWYWVPEAFVEAPHAMPMLESVSEVKLPPMGIAAGVTVLSAVS